MAGIYVLYIIGGFCLTANFLMCVLPMTLAAIAGLLTCGFVCCDAYVCKGESWSTKCCGCIFSPLLIFLGWALYCFFTSVWAVSFGMICAFLHLFRVILALFFNPSLVCKSGIFTLFFQSIFLISPWGILITHPPLGNAPVQPQVQVQPPPVSQPHVQVTVAPVGEADDNPPPAYSATAQDINTIPAAAPADPVRRISRAASFLDPRHGADKRRATVQQLRAIPVPENPFKCECIESTIVGILWIGLCLLIVAMIVLSEGGGGGFEDLSPRIMMCTMVAKYPWNHEIYFMDID
jgi:hypothetical protein